MTEFSPHQIPFPIRDLSHRCSPFDYRTTAEYETARRICKMTISNIVAMPYPPLAQGAAEEPGRAPDLSGLLYGDDGPLKVLPVMFIIWPLTCMNSHDCTSDEQRA